MGALFVGHYVGYAEECSRLAAEKCRGVAKHRGRHAVGGVEEFYFRPTTATQRLIRVSRFARDSGRSRSCARQRREWCPWEPLK